MPTAVQGPLASSEPAISSGRRLALVVGVNGRPVPGRDALKYAVQDASEVAQILQDACGFELLPVSA